MAQDDDDDLDGIDFVSRAEADGRKDTRKRVAARKKATIKPAADPEFDLQAEYPGIPADPFGPGVPIPDQIKRPRGRPRKDPNAPPKAEEVGKFGGGFSVHQGVTVNWLADAFGISRDTVNRRIQSLRPIGERKGSRLYDFREAADCIAQPKIDLAQAMRRLSPSDIPVWISQNFWKAQNEKLSYAVSSGDLWSSAAVIGSISEVLKVVRRRMLTLDTAIEKGARDGKTATEVIRAVMIELEAEMQKVAGEDPLRAYRSQMYEAEMAAMEADDGSIFDGVEAGDEAEGDEDA